MALAGPIDGESFQAYIGKVLLPTLRPGDIVIMDNLGSHKGKAVRQLIRAAGAKLLFLPKYSPDLNPIEQVFAKLKHLCEKPQREPSTPSARNWPNPWHIYPRGVRQLFQEFRLCTNVKSSRSNSGI